MPIRITCPSCAAVLNVPDAAAGKTGKCPKCQAAVAVPPPAPQFEVVDEPATPSARPTAPVADRPGARRPVADAAPGDRPRGRREPDDRDDDDRPRSRRRDSDDRDDDDRPRGRRRDRDDRDDDDRPARRQPARGKGKSDGNGKVVILAVVGVAVLVLVVGGGIGAWLMFGSSDAPAGGGGVPMGIQAAGPKTAEWTRFDSPDGIFTAYFPGGAGTPIDLTESASSGSGPRTQTWTQQFNGRGYSAIIWSWPPKSAGVAEPDVVAKPTGLKSNTEETVFTFSGRKALRYIVVSGDTRQTVVLAGLGNGRSVRFGVVGGNDLTFADPLAEQFFAKIELKAGTPAAPTVAPGEWPTQTLAGKAATLTVSAPVTLQLRAPSGPPPKGITQRMWQGQGALNYTVIILSRDQPFAQGSDQELDLLCDGFVKTMNFGPAKSRTPVTVGGHPGRKMMFRSGGKDIYYQATIVGSEVFTLTAAGRTPLAESDPELAKFFDSAKIK